MTIAGNNKFEDYFGNVKITGNLDIYGNYNVYGTTYTKLSEFVFANDNIIELNSNTTGAGYSGSSGIEFNRGTLPNATMIFDDDANKFYYGYAAKESIVTGTEDGYFTLGNDRSFKLNIDSCGSVTLSLIDGSSTEICTYINEILNQTNGYSSTYEYAIPVGDKIRLRSQIRGVTGRIQIEAVADDCYTTLGFSVGTTTNGVAAVLSEFGGAGSGGNSTTESYYEIDNDAANYVRLYNNAGNLEIKDKTGASYINITGNNGYFNKTSYSNNMGAFTAISSISTTGIVATPYMLLSGPNNLNGAESGLLYLNSTELLFGTDNSIDIGQAALYRPKNIYMSGILYNSGGINMYSAVDTDTVLNIYNDGNVKGYLSWIHGAGSNLRLFNEIKDNYLSLKDDGTVHIESTNNKAIELTSASGTIDCGSSTISTNGTVSGGTVSTGTADVTGGAISGTSFTAKSNPINVSTALTTDHNTLYVTTGAVNDVVLTLPLSSTVTAKEYKIFMVADGGKNVVIRTTAPDTFDDGVSTTITLDTVRDRITLESTGTWWSINYSNPVDMS